MIAAVADTHATVWYLYGDRRLSPRARSTIDEAAVAGKQIAVSAITLAELVYLVEKGRIQETAFERLLEVFQGTEVLVEAPFDRAVARAMRTVSRSEVPDLPDRIIAATAVHLGVPAISRDGKIRTSSVDTIW
jgi:PIN domain nuclease of toxin-antitoxin system